MRDSSASVCEDGVSRCISCKEDAGNEFGTDTEGVLTVLFACGREAGYLCVFAMLLVGADEINPSPGTKDGESHDSTDGLLEEPEAAEDKRDDDSLIVMASFSSRESSIDMSI